MQSEKSLKKSQLIKTYSRAYKTKANNNLLYNALIYATNKAGATVFKTSKHEFYPVGLTAFVVLGESHAALHSFPENELVWVELATCTEDINQDNFFNMFSEYISIHCKIKLDTL